MKHHRGEITIVQEGCISCISGPGVAADAAVRCECQHTLKRVIPARQRPSALVHDNSLSEPPLRAVTPAGLQLIKAVAHLSPSCSWLDLGSHMALSPHT